MNTRTKVLDTAKEYVCKDRAATHGSAEDSFSLMAKLWGAYLGIELTAVQVAAMMVLFKVARVKNNPGHQDNWIDIAGYAACGGEIGEIATLQKKSVPCDKFVGLAIAGPETKCQSCGHAWDLHSS